MDALAGGEVQRNLSTVVSMPVLGTKAQNASGKDLADLCEAFGGGHEVGIESVVHGCGRTRRGNSLRVGNNFRKDEDKHAERVITIISTC